MRDFKLRRRFNKLVKDGGAGGGAGGVLRIGTDGTTLDKTWQEISDCFTNGGYAYIARASLPGVAVFIPIVGISSADEIYIIIATADGSQIMFNCSSPDEYPVVGD